MPRRTQPRPRARLLSSIRLLSRRWSRKRGADRRGAHKSQGDRARAARSGTTSVRLRGTGRVLLALCLLVGLNLYVLYFRNGTSVPALLRAAELSRASLLGMSGPPGTPPPVQRTRKSLGRADVLPSFVRAQQLPLPDGDGESVLAALRTAGVPERLGKAVDEALQQGAAGPSELDETRGLTLYYDLEEQLQAVELRRSRGFALRAERAQVGSAEHWVSVRLERPLRVEEAVVTGVLPREGGLGEALRQAGEGESLGTTVGEIFAYDADLPVELRAGDRFSVVVEKHFLGSHFYRYGRVLAAQVEGAGGTLQAFRAELPKGQEPAFPFDLTAAYHNERGESLVRTLLRSPLRPSARGPARRPAVAHLERRVLLGLDYGAPVGTVVQALGAGKVLRRQVVAGKGITLTLNHEGTEVVYGNLGRVARSLGEGSKVRAGQVLGYVAVASGKDKPHLHLAVRVAGKPVDPQKLRSSRQPPLALSPEQRAEVARLQRRMHAPVSVARR